jgi:hypothetical protein
VTAAVSERRCHVRDHRSKSGTLAPMRRGTGLVVLGALFILGSTAGGRATAWMTAWSIAMGTVFLLWGLTARFTSRRV